MAPHFRPLNFARSAIATVPFALGLLAVAATAVESRAQSPARSCEDAIGLAVLPSPIAPWRGAPLRVIVATEKPIDGEFSLIAPDGSVAAGSRERRGGPPYFWFAEVQSPAAGKWQARLTARDAPDGCGTMVRDIAVRAAPPPRPSARDGIAWPLRGNWTRESENLFSAWIEKLFADPLEASPSWPALHFVLRDRNRNFLFNHLGLGEDDMKIVLRPDCADLPYFLRAYFAYKIGLPFGFSKCTRGGGGRAPRCTQWFSIQNADEARAPPPLPPPPAAPPKPTGFFGFAAPAAPPPPATPAAPPPKKLGLAASFGEFARTVADSVHSGSARTALADNNTDYYPVPLTQQTLRPGTIYADPYGHILMIVQRIPQSEGRAGIILAVDGQPDGTVARKRFWRGNFLFAQDPALGGPGFKRFRPVVAGRDGALRRLPNEEVAKHSQYGDFSLEQAKFGTEDFYDRMDDVMSPQPLEPQRAMMEAIDALEEQVKTRVTSIENGRKWQAGARGEANMPNGAAIFETSGPWEDFSTPSRDLRLLIAMDVVAGFPDRVVRRPERYAMPQGRGAADVKAELQRVLASELASRKFTYPRSDGSPWTLALKDAIERAVDFEMAYNPNDCTERRWGAPAGSDEASTCKRSAPQAQRAKMAQYRPWFAERRRPPRP